MKLVVDANIFDFEKIDEITLFKTEDIMELVRFLNADK